MVVLRGGTVCYERGTPVARVGQGGPGPRGANTIHFEPFNPNPSTVLGCMDLLHAPQPNPSTVEVVVDLLHTHAPLNPNPSMVLGVRDLLHKSEPLNPKPSTMLGVRTCCMSMPMEASIWFQGVFLGIQPRV